MLRHIFIFTIAFFVFSNDSHAVRVLTSSRCNNNKHCQYGFYCVDGTADNDDSSLTGRCYPNIAAKQLCNLHKMLAGRFAKIVVLIGVLLVGWSLIQGRFEWKIIITTVFGAMLLIAPYAIISFIVGDFSPGCTFIVG